jgi:hypothetical protein
MGTQLVNPTLSINRGKRFRVAPGTNCFFCSASLPEDNLISTFKNKPVQCCEICHVITNIDLYKSGNYGILVLTPRISQLSLIEFEKFRAIFTNPKVQAKSIIPQDISSILTTIDQHLTSASDLVNSIADEIKSLDNFADAMSIMNDEEYEMTKSALRYINLRPNLTNPFFKNLLFREQKKYIPSMTNSKVLSKIQSFTSNLVQDNDSE